MKTVHFGSGAPLPLPLVSEQATGCDRTNAAPRQQYAIVVDGTRAPSPPRSLTTRSNTSSALTSSTPNSVVAVVTLSATCTRPATIRYTTTSYVLAPPVH